MAKILIVDDDELLSEMLSLRLTADGHAATRAVDGRDGVDKALTKPFDMVLMDIQMPEMDGGQAVTALRNLGYKGLLVGLSGNTVTADIEAALDNGFDAYITKPIGSDFEMRIAKLLHGGL